MLMSTVSIKLCEQRGPVLRLMRFTGFDLVNSFSVPGFRRFL